MRGPVPGRILPLFVLALLAGAGACSRHESAPARPPDAPRSQDHATPRPADTPPSPPAATAAPATRNADTAPHTGAPAPGAAPETATVTPAAGAEANGTPAEFGAQAALLYRVAACAPGAALPEPYESSKADYCRWLDALVARYHDHYLSEAGPFLAALRPHELPATVVYPFGGGDLLSALTTFPDAREITTLSLELAGDPRRIDHLDAEGVARSLATIRASIGGLLSQNDSTSDNLMKAQRGEIPGQIAFFLVALRLHGFEPVGLRYFRLEDDGSMHYLTAADIAAVEARTARPRHGKWTPPDFSEAFANSEITFHRAGVPDDPPRVHRHFGTNLADDALARRPALLAHLEKKGRIASMTKAASYCLWNPGFSKVRDYLLRSSDFMISDSTGIPPHYARGAGFVQETYGTFSGSFLPASKTYNDEFRALWAAQPHRRLPFRYGYLDAAKAYHLLVTRRDGAGHQG